MLSNEIPLFAQLEDGFKQDMRFRPEVEHGNMVAADTH